MLGKSTGKIENLENRNTIVISNYPAKKKKNNHINKSFNI